MNGPANAMMNVKVGFQLQFKKAFTQNTIQEIMNAALNSTVGNKSGEVI